MNTTTNTTTNATVSTTVEPSSAPLIGVGGYCSLCPGGLALPDPNRRFINVPDDALSCGGLDELLILLETQEDCEQTESAFNGTFNPSIYCHCPDLEPTGMCDLCDNNHTIANPNRMINGALCSDYGALAAATTSGEFCQFILDVEGITEACCNVDGDLSQVVTSKVGLYDANPDDDFDTFFARETSGAILLQTTFAQQLRGLALAFVAFLFN